MAAQTTRYGIATTMALLYAGALERRMGRIFNEPFPVFDWKVGEATTTAWLPFVDIVEDPEYIRLVAELPGVKPEEVKIFVEGSLLTIKGAG